MSKIYLVVCDVFNSGLLDFQKTYLSFTDKDKALNHVLRIEEDYNKFANFFERVEEVCQDLNHEDILKYVENLAIPREWSMQFSDYRMAHPEYKLSENYINSFPELKEIVLV